MGVLLVRGTDGPSRVKEIEARASESHDDCLRCRRFSVGSAGLAVGVSAEKSVTMGRDSRRRRRRNGLHEEGPHRMLESGDRTVGVGEGGLEMGEDLCSCGPTVVFGR